MSQDILEQYDRNQNLYKSFSEKMKELISDILREKGIKIHSVADRVKDRESLKRKLQRPGSNFGDLADVTDICSIRIITYFEDDVDKIAKLLEREFKIDKKNSVDKRKLLDPDRFGYLSLHHIVSLPDERCKLTEYRKFTGLKAEIQTRSILQHAWAEIEHDLGYKTKLEVPNPVIRRFSRLASLLEVADEGFTNLRDTLADYERDVPQRIENTPQKVRIDKASLIAFVRKDKVVKRLDRYIASVGKVGIEYNPKIIAGDVKYLQYFSIDTIAELQFELNQCAAEIERFAEQWLRESPSKALQKGEPMNMGICLFYLYYVKIARTNNIKEIEQYIESFGIVHNESPREIAEQILETYNAIKA